MAGILLLGWSAYRNKTSHHRGVFRWPTRNESFLMFQVALFHVYLAFVPEFWALQFLDSIKVNLLFSLTPFLSAFLSFALLHKKLSFKKWLGLGCGMLGMLCIMFTQNLGEIGFSYFCGISLPEIVLLLGIISACYAWFVIRRLMHCGYQLLTINGIAFLGGGIACLMQYFWQYGLQARLLPISDASQFLALIGLLILTSNIIGYYLYGTLLKKHSNTFVSFSGFLCPIFGMFYAKLFAMLWPQYFTNEIISSWYLCGFFAIFVGLIIFYGQEVMEENASFFS
jgi:drug/metabolite transporter (DMT)-like permease